MCYVHDFARRSSNMHILQAGLYIWYVLEETVECFRNLALSNVALPIATSGYPDNYRVQCWLDVHLPTSC